ncbi:MAG: protein kinase [Byssovorax sp.]
MSHPAGASIGHYRLVRLLGSGAMGKVYLARDARLGRLVALKLISHEMLDAREVRKQFDLEARATARLSHPNVVTLYDVGEEDGRPWVALEYLEGRTLGQRMQQDWPGPAEALRIGLAIARAIEAAHAAGVLHRDLKPGNVLLASDGRPRVLDFGIARFVGGSGEEERPTTGSRPSSSLLGEGTFQFLGTPPYMAPEQWRREDKPATDIWALGLILYELLSRRHPFKGLDPGQIALRTNAEQPVEAPPEFQSIPTDLAALVMRCLEKEPADRPSAAELREGLEAIEARQHASAPGESPFRGLLPFTEQHADLFFGREREVTAFVERMRRQAVLLVVGPSGAGKSSFVRAGVLPRLQETGNWQVILVRPEARPLAALAAAVARLAVSTGTGSLARAVDPEDAVTLVERSKANAASPARAHADPEDVARRLLESPALLAVVLGEVAAKTASRVLLVVDQLEEVFAVEGDEGERRAFVEAACLAAGDEDEPVRVVMTLRDDFLGRIPWGASAPLALGGAFLLTPPEPDALREIVSRPLTRFGYRLDDPALLEEMIASVRGEVACLPLLEFAMSRLWSRRDEGRRLLLRSDYEAMGAVGGALATHAEEVLGALSPPRVELARQLLLRLVTGEGTRRAVRRSALLDGLVPDAAGVLASLLDARLLAQRPGDDGGVELAHESLTRVWRRLARWIVESHEDLALASDLTEAAERWARRGRRDDELWTGDALRDAARLRDRGSTQLTPAAIELVDRSRARARRLLRAKRALFGALIAATSVAALASSIAAWAFSARQREAAAAHARSEQARALLLEERALASFAEEDYRASRAQLRSALEARDSVPLRNLARRLAAEPSLFYLPELDVVYEARLLDDRRTIAAANQDGTVELYDMETLARRALRGHVDQVIALAPAPGGRAVTASWNGDVRLFDLARGESKLLLEGRGGIRALAADGAHVAVSHGAEITFLEIDGTAPPRTIDPGLRHILGVAFGDAGRTLFLGGASGAVIAIDRDKGEPIRASEAGAAITRLRLDPKGRFLASVHRDGTLALWDPATLALRRRIQAHVGDSRGLAIDEGGLVWTGGTDRRVIAWDPENGRAVAEHPTRLSAVVSLTLSPDGPLIASGTSGIEAWSTQIAAPPAAITSHDDGVLNVAFSPDSATLASISAARVLLWDVATGRPIADLRRGGHAGREITFDATGTRLAASGERGALEIWEMPAGKSLGEIGPDLVGPNGLAYDARRDLAIVGALDGVLRVIEPSTRRLVRELRGHRAGVHAVVLSPDARTAYSASIDGSVRAWDLATGRAKTLLDHDVSCQGLALSPDGGTLLAVDANGQATLIDVKTGAPRALARFPGRLYNAAFDPGGRTAAIACSDGNAYLVDIASGDRRAVPGHHREVNGVAISPDGRWLATASDDHTVRLFDAATGEPRWKSANRPAPRARPEGAEPGVTALLHLGERSIVGFDNGAVEVRAPGRGPVALRETPTGAVAVLAPGPSETLIAGFDDGVLGVWDPASGRLLDRARLHGGVIRAGAEGSAIKAESELGDRATIDLTVLGQPYCDVLRQVWRAIPFEWRDGAPRIEPPPAHACR